MPEVKKILLIRLSSIGDITLTTPLIRHLAAAYPDAQIDYCTKSPFVSLFISNPRITKTYTTDHPPVGNYDLVVDLQNNYRSRAIVRSMSSVRTARYRKNNWKKWLLVHFKLDLYGSYRSVVNRYGDSLHEIGISASDQQGCEIYLSSEELAYSAPYFQTPQKTLALCFGAKHFTKRYPPKIFAALISSLLKKELLQIVLLGGKEDVPQSIELLNSLPDTCRSQVVNLAGNCTLMQSAAILSRSDAVLCNDTGLMHIASAFGKKLFVLFGSSSQAFGFLPLNTPYELFEVEGLHCKPCSHIGRNHCPKAHFRCMNDLSPYTIAEHIHNYLKLLP